ncbi:MAG: MOSC N-terminal beta barrel domain-containing protein [Gammaproteobacteria bacterium]|nr:MOSC N-terminal beta barrel domain-containing protein [Gammaproteobacteria bacterium]
MSRATLSIRIVSLHIYPVKSCHRLDVAAATLAPRGLEGDREWMVTTVDGRFITQRTHPALARLRPERIGPRLMLHCPGLDPLELPAAGGTNWARRRVRVWNDEVEASVAGEPARAWLHRALGIEAELVRAGEFTQRQPSGPWTGGRDTPVNFPDAFPLLVCSTASLDDLNARLPAPLPMTRFRPNLVIEGLAPYEEDAIDTLRFEGCELRLVKPCTRCATTHVDQERGEPTTGPLEALRQYRFDRELRGVAFGQNALLVAGTGRRLEADMRGEALRREP